MLGGEEGLGCDSCRWDEIGANALAPISFHPHESQSLNIWGALDESGTDDAVT